MDEINFQDIDWINEKFGFSLDPTKLQATLSFALLWNLLEFKICGTNFAISDFEKHISNNNIDINIFNDDFQFFKKRSLNIFHYNDIDDFIDKGLCVRTPDHKEMIKQLLLKDHIENVNDVLSLILITQRLRDNLFHGIKQIEGLHEQEINFEHANSIIKKILEYCQ